MHDDWILSAEIPAHRNNIFDKDTAALRKASRGSLNFDFSGSVSKIFNKYQKIKFLFQNLSDANSKPKIFKEVPVSDWQILRTLKIF